MTRATLLTVALLLFVCGIANEAEAALMAFWSGNGNALDTTGNNDGALVNGVTFGPSQMPSQNAFSFDGSS